MSNVQTFNEVMPIQNFKTELYQQNKSTQDELEYLQQAETDYSDEEVHKLNATGIDTSTSAT